MFWYHACDLRKSPTKSLLGIMRPLYIKEYIELFSLFAIHVQITEYTQMKDALLEPP